ncbi:MAG: hypothetical protein HYR86_05205 [Candidatus Rokubacteria bacterium]|nr:hypothetical protein [Candidatus Rokubacteria bacterium]
MALAIGALLGSPGAAGAQGAETAGMLTEIKVGRGRVEMKTGGADWRPATPLSALVVFGLVTVKLSVLLPFNARLVGLKPLLIVGGPTTVRLAFDVFPAPAVVALACTLLFFTPAVVP